MNSAPAFLAAAVLVFAAPEAPAAQPAIQIQTLQKSTRSWDGRLLPSYPRGQPEVTILRLTLPPGTALPMHKHPVINAAVLLRGELVIELESGRRKRLRAGEGVIEVVEQWHFGKAVGREPAELVVFYAGAPGIPLTILQQDSSKRSRGGR